MADAAKRRNSRNLPAGGVNLDRERRKMEQDMNKRNEQAKRAIEKSQKKLDKDMKALDQKRQKFMKEKNETEALKRQLIQEKDIWLNRAKKGKVDGPTVLKELEDKVKENTERKHEADLEWGKIKDERKELKDEETAIKKDRSTLEKNKAKLADERKEFDDRMKVLEEKESANEAEKNRLAELEEKLKQGEEAVAARGKEYDMLDMKMKDRELTVQKTGDQLKLERSQIEDLKKNLYNTLMKHRQAFGDRYQAIGDVINKWNTTFDDLFAGVGEKAEAGDSPPQPEADEAPEEAAEEL